MVPTEPTNSGRLMLRCRRVHTRTLPTLRAKAFFVPALGRVFSDQPSPGPDQSDDRDRRRPQKEAKEAKEARLMKRLRHRAPIFSAAPSRRPTRWMVGEKWMAARARVGIPRPTEICARWKSGTAAPEAMPSAKCTKTRYHCPEAHDRVPFVPC